MHNHISYHLLTYDVIKGITYRIPNILLITMPIVATIAPSINEFFFMLVPLPKLIKYVKHLKQFIFFILYQIIAYF